MVATADWGDPFQTLDPARWEFSPTRASIVAGGRLRLLSVYADPVDLADGVVSRAPGEAWSIPATDLRGSAFTVEWWAADDTASGVTHAAVFTDSPHRNGLAWRIGLDTTSQWGWTLRAVRVVAGVQTVVGAVQPDPQQARHLRISEDAGVVTWATSPDGFTWAPVGSWTTTLDLSAVRIALGCWYESVGDVGGGVAEFDNLNADPTRQDVPTITGEDGEPYLAVDVQPDVVTGVFRVGTSRVGGPDRLAWSQQDAAPWVNVVCVVRSANYRRGATRQQGLLTRTEAGTGTVVLEDPAGQFDPNLNGGAIRKGTPARLRAWGTGVEGERWDAVLFTGDVDDLGVSYSPGEDAPLVAMTLVDLVGPLVGWESEGLDGDGAGAGDNLAQRAQRILTTVGRGEVSTASSGTYTATLAGTPLRQPWEELNRAAEAELGRLWIDRHNRLQLRSRGSQPSGPVRGTLSDVHGEAPVGVHGCVADASIVSSGDVVNRVLGSRVKLEAEPVEPPLIRRDDEQSARLYGVGSVNRERSLLLQTDAQVTAWAGALIVARTRPELRVESVTPRPSSEDLDSTLQQWPAVLRTDLGDRWLFTYHPPAGPPIVRGLAVLGIDVSATPDGWTVQWATEPAPVPGAGNPAGWFIVGTSQVGGPDLLAPYGAPYAAA
jgi:hypothetical protein